MTAKPRSNRRVVFPWENPEPERRPERRLVGRQDHGRELQAPLVLHGF